MHLLILLVHFSIVLFGVRPSIINLLCYFKIIYYLYIFLTITTATAITIIIIIIGGGGVNNNNNNNNLCILNRTIKTVCTICVIHI